MGITARDLFYSSLLHLAFLMALVFLNPFKVISRNLETIAVNIISMPPLGDPALIKAQMPEVSIPEAIVQEEVAIPIATPESRTKPLPVEEKQPQPETPKKENRDTGYPGDRKTGDKTEAGADVSGQLGPGSPFGSAQVDNADFNYPTYFIHAFGKIERNWSNPVRANQSLSCFIHFSVLRSGTILDPVITKSSGVEAYDRACLRALQASDPLPPLPSEFLDDIIGITLEFPHIPGKL